MERDFITDFLYHLFSEDKKEHPFPLTAESNFFIKIRAALTHWNISKSTQKEGE